MRRLRVARARPELPRVRIPLSQVVASVWWPYAPHPTLTDQTILVALLSFSDSR
jgi:hypothetical protein